MAVKYLKTYPEKCITCGVCMNVCSGTFFKKEDPEYSCIRINVKEDKKVDIVVCNQTCRKCVDECPTGALTVNSKGVVMFNKDTCVGCLACVAACPINAMMWKKGEKFPFKCIACGACARQCPTKAIEIVEE